MACKRELYRVVACLHRANRITLCVASVPDARRLLRAPFARATTPVVSSAGGSRNTFIHQSAAKIIRTGVETSGHPLLAHLDPRDLNIRNDGMQSETRHRVHQQGFTKSGPRSCASLAIQRCFHGHKGQRHKFGKAAGSFLQRADFEQMRRPVLCALHVPEHDGGGTSKANLVGGAYDG